MNYKKNILIVIPGCHTGGTVASLNSLLNTSFTQKYDVRVFVMNAFGIERFPSIASRSIGTHKICTLLYANMKNYGIWISLQLLPIKILIRIPLFGKSIHEAIDRYIIKRIEKKIKIDHVISFAESQSLRFVAKFNCPQKTTWIHCDYGISCPTEFDEYETFNKYNNIVCVSEYTQKSFCNRFPSLEKKVHCIYNIVDYNYVIERGNEILNDDRFDTQNFTIISIGRIDPIKRFSQIPAIARMLKDDNMSFKWYIIGGSKGAKEEIAKINEQILLQRVEDCVIMLGHKENPYPYFKLANLLVSTSKSEACPMIFNEAKAFKTPIVTTNFGSAAEFINNGLDGYVTPIDNMYGILKMLINNTDNYYTNLNPSIGISLHTDSILNRIENLIK